MADRPATGPAPVHGGRLRQLGAFVALVAGCAALLAATVQLTGARIAESRARLESRALLWLLDTDDAPAGTWVDDRWTLCDGRSLLRGRAAGYGGDIHWMIALDTAGARPTIRRVLVTEHRETPGIADFLNDPAQGWLASLRGRDAALTDIDTLAGATITTRALGRSIAGAMTAVDASTTTPAAARTAADAEADADCTP